MVCSTIYVFRTDWMAQAVDACPEHSPVICSLRSNITKKFLQQAGLESKMHNCLRIGRGFFCSGQSSWRSCENDLTSWRGCDAEHCWLLPITMKPRVAEFHIAARFADS